MDLETLGWCVDSWYSWSGMLQTEALAEEVVDRWYEQLSNLDFYKDGWVTLNRTGSIVTITHAIPEADRDDGTRLRVDVNPDEYLPKLVIVKE